MTKLKYIQSMGNQLMAVMDDGKKFYAVPTGQNMWLHSKTVGGGSGPVDPGTGTFAPPFPWDSVWDYNEFHSPSRPNHDGIDFGPGLGVNAGDSIRAAGAGIVEFAGWGGDWFNSPGFGNLVVLNHGTFNGVEVTTRYAHMSTLPDVHTGDTVTKLQHLGPVGETGNAVGAHLHWETVLDGVAINPRDFMAVYGA